jgi:molybdate transport system ATP-binding protein
MSEPANGVRVRLARDGFALDVDLAWDERVVVIFGPSGSGKTTLFEVLLGLHPAAEATVRLGGDWLDDPERGLHVPVWQRGLGWVPQDPTLFPHLPVLIDVLEISALLERRVDSLSGGERQRVAIARAIASGPRALLMDEPLASLDVGLRARALPYLRRLRDDLEIPILYITHDPDEALLMGERVIVLDAGREVASGAPSAVLWSRAVLPLAEALGIENVLDAFVVASASGESTLQTARGLRLTIPFALEAGTSISVGLRAEEVLLAADPPGRISARNVLAATVSSCQPRGADAFVHLDVGGRGGSAPERLVAKITRAAAESLALRPGVSVHAVIKAQAIRRVA